MIMHGIVDHAGTLQARGHYNWIPLPTPQVEKEGEPPLLPPQPKVTSTSKIQAQITSMPGQSAFHMEHEHNGPDYSLSLKGVNVNPFDRPSSPSYFSSTTGIFSASLLHSISKSWALGLETTLQKPYPDSQELSTSYSMRWAPEPSSSTPLPLPPTLTEGTQSPYMPISPTDPVQVFTTTWSPSSGMLHSSYWRRLNQRLEFVTELQMLLTPSSSGGPGRREGTFNCS